MAKAVRVAKVAAMTKLQRVARATVVGASLLVVAASVLVIGCAALGIPLGLQISW